ncbi:mitotic spindle-associated MMXD complex subunit MIP18 [Brachionus plicatilis]|uniref:Mitotic spindle-associated MMXD complex subunit MIP18 n=1 Tax=Brachionus plicatilis TaxID=10195 RepID=A0A3M7PI47_BRAPC|nr:mitotic spindle-associated MMXD complex subunit MIP18 [Brachionus plicatilis]
MVVENVNPSVYQRLEERTVSETDYDNNYEDMIDEREVFDIIRNLQDPEHPLTLEELNVLDIDSIKIDNKSSTCRVEFTPTIPHCSMATLIGLSIKVKLLRSLPSNFKTEVSIKEGTHASETAINKQLADKERVAAALENMNLLQVVNRCLEDEYNR